MADCSCCEPNTKTWMDVLFGWISILQSFGGLFCTLFLLYLNRQVANLYAKERRPIVVCVARVAIDLLVLGLLILVRYWLGSDTKDATLSFVIPNYYIFGVYRIFGEITLISVPIGFVAAIAEHWVIGYIWEWQPLFVVILMLIPQFYDLLEKPVRSFWSARIEMPKDVNERYISLLEERIEGLERKLKAKQKYIDQLTIRKKNEQMMRPPEQFVQRNHKDIEKEMIQMEKKLKGLEIVAKNAVEERGKVERQKEELEQTVKQLKQIESDMKKKHKSEIQSHKENLSRAVSHSHDLKEKVAALREENVKLRSVQDELTALQGKFKQVERNLENERKRHKSERNSLLANNQKIKDDLNSCLSKYKLLKDQMSDFELNAAVSPPPAKQLDDIFQTVKDIFPLIKRDTVVSALLELRTRDGGQLKGGKALTVGRIVKSLDDKIETQKVKTELVPSCSQSECSICSVGMEVVKCEKCKHKFHTECLTEWLNNNVNQSQCRSEWISE